MTAPTAIQNDVLVHDTPWTVAPVPPGLETDQFFPFQRSTTDLLSAEAPTAIQNDALTHDTPVI